MESADRFEIKCPPHDMFLMNIPSISSLTLYEQFDKATALPQLEKALATLAQANPPLLGVLVPDPSSGEGRVKVVGNHRKEVPLSVVLAPSDVVIPAQLKDRLALLQRVSTELPNMPNASILLQTGAPLVTVSVMLFPGDCAVFKFDVCHMIADGLAYYNFMGQLTSLCHGKKVPKTIWQAAPKIVAVPAHFSEETAVALQQSWVPELVRRMSAEPPRTPTLLLVDKAVIPKLKEEYMAAAKRANTPVPFLSTNDLIQAAYEEVTDNSFGGMYANMRGRTEFKYCQNFAMNFERCIYHDRKVFAGKPAMVRRILSTEFVYYNERDLKPDFEAAKKLDMFVVTNWASLTQFCTPADSKVLAHRPPNIFIDLPMDLGVVFLADTNTIALLCNFNFNDPAFLKRVDESCIFKRLFGSSLVSMRSSDSAAGKASDNV